MLRLLITVVGLVGVIQAAPQTKLDARIVGGEPADIEDYSYQVALLHFSSLRCGAVIISEDYVVTAAHCTSGYVYRKFISFS